MDPIKEFLVANSINGLKEKFSVTTQYDSPSFCPLCGAIVHEQFLCDGCFDFYPQGKDAPFQFILLLRTLKIMKTIGTNALDIFPSLKLREKVAKKYDCKSWICAHATLSRDEVDRSKPLCLLRTNIIESNKAKEVICKFQDNPEECPYYTKVLNAEETIKRITQLIPVKDQIDDWNNQK